MIQQNKEYNTWQEFLEGLLNGNLSLNQFKNRRHRARQACKRKQVLAMAKAWELYLLETTYNKAD